MIFFLKYIFRRFIAIIFLICGFGFAFAQMPQPPEIAARSFLIIDVSANQVLAQKDANTPVEPASLTKLMTAYLVFQAMESKKINLAQTLPVSNRAWKMPGSRMFIDPKMQVPVEDLIKGMIVQSGNDATISLAEGVGGSVEKFVQLMNMQAKALRMQQTSYKNPEGLTEAGHTTTAHDLSILATRLMQDFPMHLHFYSIKKYRYSGTPLANDTNRNLLLFRDPTVDGLKTGHTDTAGYCLIATAKRDFPNLAGRRLLAIVLGASSEVSRANEAQKLINWGFTAFDAVQLFAAAQPIISPAVWKGKENTVGVGRPQAIIVAAPQGQADRIKTKVERPDPFVAPIALGQNMATLKVFIDNRTLLDVPLVSLSPVEEAGIFGRAWDVLRLWIK